MNRPPTIDSMFQARSLADAEAVVLAIPYDRTASARRGAVNGPRAIAEAFAFQIEFLDIPTKREIGYEFKIHLEDMGDLNALTPEQAVVAIRTKYEALPHVPTVVIGGDHSVSIGVFQALARSEVVAAQDVTILQIDAHMDLRNDDSDSNPSDEPASLYSHASVARRARELGFQIVQVGVRSYSKEEWDFASEHDVTTFEWSDSHHASVEDILAAIRTEAVYLEIDIDGFDPSLCPGTGTPVPGGLDWWFGRDLCRAVIDTKKFVGAGIVEVAPIAGSNVTERVAANLCYDIFCRVLARDG